MRTPIPPSPTIIALLDPFRNLFCADDFARFVDHTTCLMTCPAPACITQVQRTAEHERHYSRHRDFLAHSRVCLRQLRATACRRVGLEAMTTRLSHGRDVLVCVEDDTIRRRPHGPKLFGCAWHHDHAAGPGHTEKVNGQSLVMLAVVPNALDPAGARAWVCDAQLWVPWKRSTELGHATLDYESKAGLADLMLRHQRDWIPDSLERLVLVDSLYAKAPFLNAMSSHRLTHVLGRLACNRAVYHTPPAREPGQRGRSRVRGERVDWKAEFEQHKREVVLRLYGRDDKAQVWGMTGRVNGYNHDVRLVVSRLERGKKANLFLCTDTSLKDEEILELYAARFSVEEAIKDLVLEMELGGERSRVGQVYQMQVALKICAGLLLRALGESQPESVREVLRDPWRKRLPRLSIGQTRQGLWWESLSGGELFRRDGLDRARGRNGPEAFSNHVA